MLRVLMAVYELLFAMRFLDAVADHVARARPLVDRLAGYVVSDSPTPVAGGAQGEVMYPLDFTPYADAPSRTSFATEAIAADQERLASQQQPDGGWTVTFPPYSPAATLEWRGYATVRAVVEVALTPSDAITRSRAVAVAARSVRGTVSVVAPVLTVSASRTVDQEHQVRHLVRRGRRSGPRDQHAEQHRQRGQHPGRPPAIDRAAAGHHVRPSRSPSVAIRSTPLCRPPSPSDASGRCGE